jgi:hypothetical protein
MDTTTSEVGLGLLDPTVVRVFLDELRDAGYNIGMSQYIAAYDLILALVARGELPDQPQRLQGLLGPIVCSSPSEQNDFQHRYARWIALLGGATERTRVPNTVDEVSKGRELEQELRQVGQQLQWWKWGMVGGVIVFIVGLLYVYAILFPQ